MEAGKIRAPGSLPAFRCGYQLPASSWSRMLQDHPELFGPFMVAGFMDSYDASLGISRTTFRKIVEQAVDEALRTGVITSSASGITASTTRRSRRCFGRPPHSIRSKRGKRVAQRAKASGNLGMPVGQASRIWLQNGAGASAICAASLSLARETFSRRWKRGISVPQPCPRASATLQKMLENLPRRRADARAPWPSHRARAPGRRLGRRTPCSNARRLGRSQLMPSSRLSSRARARPWRARPGPRVVLGRACPSRRPAIRPCPPRERVQVHRGLALSRSGEGRRENP